MTRPERPRIEEALAVAFGAERAELDASCQRVRFLRDGTWCERALIPTLGREGICDPAEAWEALAARGVIPIDWVHTPLREFESRQPVMDVVIAELLARYGGEQLTERMAQQVRAEAIEMLASRSGLSRDEIRENVSFRVQGSRIDMETPGWFPSKLGYVTGRLRQPRTVADCVAFAADVEGMLRAEAIARELAHWIFANSPMRAPAKFMWRVGARRAFSMQRFGIITSDDLVNLGQLVADAEPSDLPRLRQRADYATPLGLGWRGSELVDDFEALAATGYELDYLQNDVIGLRCPPLEGED